MTENFPLEPSAAAAQAAIAEEFSLFSDWSERYQYLIDLGRKLPDLPAALKTDATRLHGCQSNVWIVTLIPRLLRRRPSDAAVMPLPREETTPPVTKIYFAMELPPAHSLKHMLTILPRIARECQDIDYSWMLSSFFLRLLLALAAALLEPDVERLACERLTSGGFHSVRPHWPSPS